MKQLGLLVTMQPSVKEKNAAMVEWTEQERSIITNIFGNLDYEDVGSKALSRCLIVYPWTQRYFASFGNLYNAEAIKTNPNIAAHGTKVLHGLDRAVKNMDNIKATYAELSVLHSEKLHVDPDNFKLLADCLTIVIAAKLGSAFSPEIQATFQKFLAVVVSALGRQYH
uniref:Leucine carboxyl methyltransferase 1 n=3 Tax=Oryzias TaxID=8089 RepID=A0A3P9H9S9_ORYLA